MNENFGDKMISVREIFEIMLGKENSDKVFQQLQQDFKDGKRGDDLIVSARNLISNMYAKGTYFESYMLPSIAILVGPRGSEL